MECLHSWYGIYTETESSVRYMYGIAPYMDYPCFIPCWWWHGGGAHLPYSPTHASCPVLSHRSHAILTLHVESRIGEQRGEGQPLEGADGAPAELRLGKIHLVDLAGSERVAMSGAEGETLVETQSINLSLTALGE